MSGNRSTARSAALLAPIVLQGCGLPAERPNDTQSRAWSGRITNQNCLEIVPDAAPLVVSARFQPEDIDGVYAGRQAEVKFLSLHDRDLPMLLGVIRNVSADSMDDKTTGARYFTAEIVVPDDQVAMLRRLRGADTGIRPGVPVQVTVKLQPRTALQYLLDPITEATMGALHER